MNKTNNFKLFVGNDLETKFVEYKKDRDALVNRAALVYGLPKNLLDDEHIIRSEKGKPFFEKLNMHFSVSHSDDLWTCLMGPSCCGFDVQYIKPCNFEKIAGRFFSENEQRYVNQNGIEAFFDVWSMREAYGKYTGQGFWGEMPEFVDEEGKLILIQQECKLVFIDLGKDHRCVACIGIGQDEDIEIIKEW